MQLNSPYPANLITSDQTGLFASATALNLSGAYLYGLITGVSSSGGNGDAGATGTILNNKIDALSGFVTGNVQGLGISGALDTKILNLSGYDSNTYSTIVNLGLTGSNLYKFFSGLSGNLGTTGSTLYSQYVTLTNNLTTTGTNLYLVINNLSGLVTGVYATFDALTSTGINLQNQINGINTAGYITTGLADNRFVHLTGTETISGAKTFRAPLKILTAAGDGIVFNVSSLSGTYNGNTGAGNEVDILDGYLKTVPNIITLDWTNRFLSGEWGTSAVGVNTSSVVNYGALQSVSGYLKTLITAASAGVSSINGQSGSLSFTQAGNVYITTGIGFINFSGSAPDSSSFATLVQLTALSGFVSGQSGYEASVYATQSSLALTGQQAVNVANSNALNLSGNLTATGIALIARDLAISGALQAQIGGAAGTTVTVTGSSAMTSADFSGYGGTVVFRSGNTVLISGGAGGGTANALTGLVAGTNVTVSNNGNGTATVNTILPPTYNPSGSYIFRTYITSGLSGQFIPFPFNLAPNPRVLATLGNTIGANIVPYQVSGIVGTGFWINFADSIDYTGYYVDAMGVTDNTGLASTLITNTFNTYNNTTPSGLYQAGSSSEIDLRIGASGYIEILGNSVSGAAPSTSNLNLPISTNVYGNNTILMAAPDGWLQILVSGRTAKIPYYY